MGGERPHLVVSVDLATLQGRGEQLVDLDCGPVTLDAVRRLACDASLTRVVMGPGSEPLDVGRRTRVVPASLRRALNHRDGGCTHPGCDTPAHWCDAHHITHWADGGGTDSANLRSCAEGTTGSPTNTSPTRPVGREPRRPIPTVGHGRASMCPLS